MCIHTARSMALGRAACLRTTLPLPLRRVAAAAPRPRLVAAHGACAGTASPSLTQPRACCAPRLAMAKPGSQRAIAAAATAPAADAVNSAAAEGAPFTITTPLYYVNAAPHMGSAYPTIAADVAARYQRMRGRAVRFLTGTDEHGEKIAAAAAARGLEPKEHCDQIAAEYARLWRDLDVSYDGFVRTTDDSHAAVVAEVLGRVWDRGDIYRAAYEGWYCVDCEEYKDETEMDEGHVCPVHRKPCAHRSEDNYFFALSKYQDKLAALIDGTDFVQPAARRNEVLGWVRSGLRDFSISRCNVDWGIRVPRDPGHTVYVWFDALNGYLSGLVSLAAAGGRNGSSSNGSSSNGGSGAVMPAGGGAPPGWPADVHVIGKDILRFHAVYWPAMLMSAGLEPPKSVFGHGFLTKDGLKMGKALGNTLDPAALVAGYGPDAVRYYFMRRVPFGQDGDFSEPTFRDTVNAELANTVGNMLNRTLGLLHKYCDGVLPVSAADAAPEGSDHPLRLAAAEGAAKAAEAYDALAPHLALEAAVAVAARGNLFLEETAPWTALKKGSEEEQAAARAALVAVLEAARIVALLISPVTPRLAARVAEQLGLQPAAAAEGGAQWADLEWGRLPAQHATPAPAPVFARIDDTVAYVTQPAPGAPAAAAAATGGGGGKGGGGGGKGGGGGGKPGMTREEKAALKQHQREAAAAKAAAAAAAKS